ncbi:recombinase family protein [Rhizobium leguminosarum]|uniref:recombinase family protein n=1 Tax=Rhizobium leguminosarum TaxID=384 RepID=UPI001441C311|nr:recombinase family protein [Rhizobium leguminosarum]MBY5868787.1 recombinase family protein [Rhizobium leguminosarum]NKM06215.1 helix-turn-helix domain-containing protein [Rhizobium leguminosarum bv. viciae]
MPSTIIGYARTSTLDQTYGLGAQLRDLETAGCEKLFKEQLSSVDRERPELTRALDYVREGDVFVVTKLDRLARSMADLVRIKDALELKGVTLKILNLNIDTSTPTGKLMLSLLGSIAEFERDIMLERQREGIARAKADGKYKGRAPTAQRKTDDVKRMKADGKTVEQIVVELGISRSSVFRALRSENSSARPQSKPVRSPAKTERS